MAIRKYYFIISSIITLSLLEWGCAIPPGSKAGLGPVSQPRAPSSSPGTVRTDILIYAGTGSWSAEIDGMTETLYRHQATYRQINSSELNAMSLDELAEFGLMIFPGGDASAMTKNLSPETHAKMRAAVQERGVSYIGFCAGAWIAIAPAPEPGQDVSYGVGVVNGPFQIANYLTKEGREYAVAKAQFASGAQRELLWYGGPITPNIPGGVLVKYPDGTPAITQIHSGKGFVIVSGFHPAAPQYVFDSLKLKNPEGLAFDYAWTLFDAALHHTELPAF